MICLLLFFLFFLCLFYFFFFNDTATTEIYTLSLHDALPISSSSAWNASEAIDKLMIPISSYPRCIHNLSDRKSTRLNSSHVAISYAVFCLKKKKKKKKAEED